MGSVFIATGLVAVPVGIVAEASWHQDYGIIFWATGVVFLGVGTLNLVWENPLEALDRDFAASARTMAPAQRVAFGAGGLTSVAASARSGRTVGAVLDFFFAALYYGIAIGEFVSANNPGSDRENAQASGASFLVLGAIFTGVGVVQLIFPSPAETALSVYNAGGAQAGGIHLSGGVLPVRGGAMVGLGGSF